MSEQEKCCCTWTEKIEVAGDRVVERVKGLIAAGNVRRIIVRNAEGKVLLDVTLTVGAIGGTAVVLMAPFLSALVAIYSLAKNVKVEVIRTTDTA